MPPFPYTELLHIIVSASKKCLKNEFLGQRAQGLVMKGITDSIS